MTNIRETSKRVFLFAIMTIGLIALGTVFPLEDPDSLSPLSRALVTGVIALIGLQQSLFFSRDQMRLHVKKRTLSSFVERASDWARRPELDETLIGMYERAIYLWTRDMYEVDISTNILYLYLIDFLTFVVAFVSSHSPELSRIKIAFFSIGTLWLPIVTFYIGLSLLIVLLFTHIGILRYSRSVLIPKKGKGEVWIRRINQRSFLERQETLEYDVGEEESLEISVSFSGKTTNGFFDARVEFSDGNYVYAPDRNTFLSNFRFGRDQYERPILMLEELPFETGVVQGKCSFENTRSVLTFRLRPTPQNDREVSYFLDESTRVERLVVSLFEDPAFLPSDRPRGTRWDPREPTRDRYRLDTVTIDLHYS